MLMVYSIYWGVCGTPEIKDWRDDGKIDFYQFHFMFPEGKNNDLKYALSIFLDCISIVIDHLQCYSIILGTHRSEMEVHGTNEVKQFCKVKI